MASETPELEQLLRDHDAFIRREVKYRGAGLKRFEAADDVVQCVFVQALLSAANFTYENDRAFRGWLRRIIDRTIADRNAYWKAQKRRAEGALRITRFGSGPDGEGAGGADPAAVQTSPSSRAGRRESIGVAMRALEILTDRDRQLMELMSDGLSIQETGDRLGLSYAAAEKARSRAMTKFRAAFEAALAE